MLGGIPLLILILLAILFIVLASSLGKLHPFLALIIASLGLGFAVGMPGQDIVRELAGGFGSITGSIGLIIVFGTIIGVVMEESGAAARIARALVHALGSRRIILTMSCVGALTGIPVFCDSGFVILSKLAKQLARQSGKSALSMNIALATALYSTHVLVPPTPGPLAAAGNYGASSFLGQVMLTGLLLALPAVLVGYWWALRSGKRYPGNTLVLPDSSPESPPEAAGPSLFLSVLPLAVPAILIAAGSVAALGEAPGWLSFLSNPSIALLLGVFSSFLLFKKLDEVHLNQWIGKALAQAGPILLITAAGGAFGAILKATPLAALFGAWIQEQEIEGIWALPVVFLLAAGLKSSQGSSTAAIIITSTLAAPLLPALGFNTGMELAVLVSVTGAGAMVVSHSNDSYFWVVSQFSGISMTRTFQTFTVATLLQGIAILLAGMLLMSLL